MKRNAQLFATGFCIAIIAIGLLCGFMAVDLSTDRYIPNRFGILFVLTSLGEEGLSFTFLGENYRVSAEWLAPAREWLTTASPWLPACLTLPARFLRAALKLE